SEAETNPTSELGQERLSPVYLATSALPLKTDKRRHVGMSASCQKRAYAPQHTGSLFDHLVGEREQRGRNFDAQCLCGGEVDDQIEFSREFDRQVAGLFALEDPADVDTGAAISIRLTWSVADQAASLSVLALIIHRRQGMPGRERHELPALTDEEYSAADEQPTGARLHDLCEGGMEFTLVGGVHHQDLPSDGMSRFLQVSRLALDIRTVWVAQHGDD